MAYMQLFTQRSRDLELFQALQGRLLLGGAPDQELFDLAEKTAASFEIDPLQKLIWMPRLRAAAKMAENVGSGNLWKKIEPIVCGEGEK